MTATDWDETSEEAWWHKRIDISFLAEMSGDMCEEEQDGNWGRRYMCVRLPGHTGRHLAVDFNARWPTAVWSGPPSEQLEAPPIHEAGDPAMPEQSTTTSIEVMTTDAGSVNYTDGTKFEYTAERFLIVYGENDKAIAVHAPGAWLYAATQKQVVRSQFTRDAA